MTTQPRLLTRVDPAAIETSTFGSSAVIPSLSVTTSSSTDLGISDPVRGSCRLGCAGSR